MDQLNHTIELTTSERKLYDIVFSNDKNNSFDKIEDRKKACLELYTSLFNRDAIPKIRLKYFDDNSYSISKTSIKQHFIKNGNKEADIYKHPNFFKYLYYFINGANLNIDVKNRFSLFLGELGDITSGDYEDIINFLKREKRKNTLDKKDYAEEVFKLLIESGIEMYNSKEIRKALLR